MKNVLRILTLTSLIVLTSCGGFSAKKEYTKLKLELKNSSSLFLYGGNNSLARGLKMARNADDISSTTRLFKMDENGYTEEVTITYTYVDKSGNEHTDTEVNTYEPSKLIPLNEKYLIIEFNNESYYIVDLKTGNAYLFSSDCLPHGSVYPSQDYYPTDNNGDVYFNKGNGYGNILCKLDVSDPNNLQVKQVSALSDDVNSNEYAVDGSGNVAYAGLDSGGNGVLRFVYNNGSIKNLPGSSNYSFTCFWQGYDSNIYCYNGSTWGSEHPSAIFKITANPFGTEFLGCDSYISSRNTGIGNIGFKRMLRCDQTKQIFLFNDDELFVVYDDNTHLVSGLQFSDINLQNVKDGRSSNGYLFFTGQDSNGDSVLVRVNPADCSTKVLIQGDYDLYKWEVSNDGVVSFNALQMSNGSIVVGTVDSSGKINVSDMSLTKEVVSFARVYQGK